MTFYDYKVIPAPKKLKRVKGVKSTADLFSATLAEAINAAAREGWEYLRAESLPAEVAGGWFRRGAEIIETVLVFRRPRETLGPRLAGSRPEASPASGPALEGARLAQSERPAPGRLHPAGERREPRLEEGAEQEAPRSPEEPRPMLRRDGPRPIGPVPRLGPADPP